MRAEYVFIFFMKAHPIIPEVKNENYTDFLSCSNRGLFCTWGTSFGLQQIKRTLCNRLAMSSDIQITNKDTNRHYSASGSNIF